MRIVATSTAYPPHYYSQEEVLAALENYWGGLAGHLDALERLHGRTRVAGRYFSLPLESYGAVDTFGKSNSAWIETSIELGAQALEAALCQAGIDRRQIGALIFASVTGISSPSIDAMLVNRMDLSPRIKRTPIFGLGCVAGAAGLARAADYVRAYPGQVAALLSVELCSLTWQRDDLSVANLISTGLFGDGAAAALVAGDEADAAIGSVAGLPGPEILGSACSFYPGTEDVMGWKVSEKGFEILLSPDVPKVVHEHLGRDVDDFLAERGMTRADIGSWIMHTGGPKVLEAAADALNLHDGELKRSWDALARIGNLSSASVLVVLDDVIRNYHPQPGTFSILAAFGPGFCSEMLLLKWSKR